MSRKETKFKQTEVGMIPKDWEVKKFESVFRSVNSRKYQIQTNEYQDSGKYAIVDQGKEKIIGWTDRQNPLRCSQNGMIVFGDHTRIFKFIKFDFFVGADGTQLLGCDDCVCTKYMYYVCSKLDIPNTGYNRHFKYLKESLFLVPPNKKEQTAIATALSDVDHLIESLGKLVAKKKRIKQGAMQQLLTGKKRLPGFGSKASPRSARNAKCSTAKPGFKQTELGTIPEDWEVKKFGELFDMSTATISVENIDPEFYVGTENMLQNKMGVVKNAVVLACSKVREYRKNDILVSNIRPYLKKIWLADKNGGCSTDVLVFRVKNKKFNPSFLYNVVADDRFFNIVNENAIGTKMPRGDKNVIKQIVFAVPSSIEEQAAIAQVLGDMDAEIGTLEAKLAKYRKLKTGMMQQLLTGKIRLV